VVLLAVVVILVAPKGTDGDEKKPSISIDQDKDQDKEQDDTINEGGLQDAGDNIDDSETIIIPPASWGDGSNGQGSGNNNTGNGNSGNSNSGNSNSGNSNTGSGNGQDDNLSGGDEPDMNGEFGMPF
jgi:hypothetical protein